MATCPNPFVLNPGSDFTRKRKLDFQTTVRCLITMQIGSQKKELLELFRYNPDAATAAQHRAKILPEALKFLLREFNSAFAHGQTYLGYRLSACDGTGLNIERNPTHKENYFQSTPRDKGVNLPRLNALNKFR